MLQISILNGVVYKSFIPGAGLANSKGSGFRAACAAAAKAVGGGTTTQQCSCSHYGQTWDSVYALSHYVYALIITH